MNKLNLAIVVLALATLVNYLTLLFTTKKKNLLREHFIYTAMLMFSFIGFAFIITSIGMGSHDNPFRLGGIMCLFIFICMAISEVVKRKETLYSYKMSIPMIIMPSLVILLFFVGNSQFRPYKYIKI